MSIGLVRIRPTKEYNPNQSVQVSILHQGKSVCSQNGYMLDIGKNVAAFYLDARGGTGRIYPVSISSKSVIGGKIKNVPSLIISDEFLSPESFTEIAFPEFEGWSIHSVSGGKTMAICMTRIIGESD